MTNLIAPRYSGRIMFPPRPKISIPPAVLPDYEKKGYVAQLKFNGTRTLIELKPGGEIKFWTRRREPHKAYKPSRGMLNTLREIHEVANPDEHMVIDGELMHSKTKSLKDTFIAFDLLVVNGDYLIGVPMIERYELLDDILIDPDQSHKLTKEKMTDRNIAIYIRKNFWLAEVFCFGFENEFKSRTDIDEIEGLVLKNPKAKLEYGHSENNNTDWQIRCRKPHKNYKY